MIHRPSVSIIGVFYYDPSSIIGPPGVFGMQWGGDSLRGFPAASTRAELRPCEYEREKRNQNETYIWYRREMRGVVAHSRSRPLLPALALPHS